MNLKTTNLVKVKGIIVYFLFGLIDEFDNEVVDEFGNPIAGL